jgi:hypothetical protein
VDDAVDHPVDGVRSAPKDSSVIPETMGSSNRSPFGKLFLQVGLFPHAVSRRVIVFWIALDPQGRFISYAGSRVVFAVSSSCRMMGLRRSDVPVWTTHSTKLSRLHPIERNHPVHVPGRDVLARRDRR